MSTRAWRQRATAAHRQLEQLAHAAATRTGRSVHRDPSRRHQAVARDLWTGPDAATPIAAARGTATARALAGYPAAETDPAALLAQVEAREFDRQLAAWRARGPVIQLDGRWLRPSRSQNQTWTPVLRPRVLVQQRVYRAERRALAETAMLARRLGVPMPTPERGQPTTWDDTDPRLYVNYRRRVASETARIVDDVVVDTHRSATLDQLEQLNVGWVRKAEATACGACLALADGRVRNAADRGFPKHTRCRCIAVPVGPYGEQPPTGREQFDALSRAEQDALFEHRGGAEKAEMLRSGSVNLDDLLLVDEDRAAVTDYIVGETPLANLRQGTYDRETYGSRGGLPTQRSQAPEGDEDARPPGVPRLEELAELNRAIHDDDGTPERFALDQRATVRSVLEDVVASYPADPSPEDIAEIAGQIAHGIASAQSFRDGNRRTAYWTTRGYLRANGLGYLMAEDDHMVARYLNQLVEDQGHARPVRVTPARFADLFRRRLKNRTPPST